MTQLERARKGEITKEIKKVAEEEELLVEAVREGVAAGTIVIPKNSKHNLVNPRGIGKGLSTKTNANIGTSPDLINLEEELVKLKIAIEAGVDTIMDLSLGGDLDQIRRTILQNSPVPVGTVPIYQAAVEAVKNKKSIVEMTSDEIFAVIEKQAQDGVDFMTVHCGITRRAVARLEAQRRITGVVSRGGAFLAEWMIFQKMENPLYQHFDRLLEVARSYDVTLSLGDGLRPGCLSDATDRAQVEELMELGELAVRAREAGVQVMIEGPGHVPLDQIVANVQLEKKICGEAPFYILGPLVTDIAMGYDHIAGAIGGALAASAGADFICYVTPAEHLRLPTVADVREGVIAARIAGHAADIAKGIRRAWNQDLAMAKARAQLDWEEQIRLSIDPIKAARYRKERPPQEASTCTMCGEFCAVKRIKNHLPQFLRSNKK